MHDIVFLFDVDNTLLDNDRLQNDLGEHLERSFGLAARERYFELYEQLRHDLGYADYLGALERYRLEHQRDPRVLTLSGWMLEYPFVERLYPHVRQVLEHVRQWGPAVILSDGDAVFQPHKVRQSGLWHACDGNVLIYVHKEDMLDEVERLFPARHYVMIDDKLRLLAAIKRVWGNRVTSVFPRQGHYAQGPGLSHYPAADIDVERIGELLRLSRAAFS